MLTQNNIWVPDDYDKDFYKDYGVFVRPINYPLSQRKIDGLLAIAEMQKFFQCNPVKMIDIMFNIELLDGQALMVQRSWFCPNVLYVCTRSYGKSTVIDLETMAKDMCFNNVWTYIASGTGGQAEQTFTTLEKLANDNIDTFSGSTGYIFKDEVEVKNAAGDGFSHSSNGFSYNLYNGSQTITLNSNIDARRGARGTVIFDECGFLSSEMIAVYGAFAVTNKSLKTGKDSSGKSIDPIRQRTFATNLPYQKFYISSASSTDTEFYKLYRDFSKQQIMGNPDFAVLHIDCEQAFKPTLHGELITPLLSRSTVESEMRRNPEKARREYYCIFTTDLGADAIIRRGVITRNEETRRPLLDNDTGDRKFVLAYDPARSRDNSIISVGEIYHDVDENGNDDIKMRICNCMNLMDVGKKIKSPMQTPDQIDYLKHLILGYNAGVDAYGNIIGIYIDAGSGGGGVNIADFLMEDWEDKTGNKHRGLIDKEYSAEYVKRFPNAVDKLKLISPSAYKSEMAEALIELVNQNKISFTAPYDNKGYLTVFDVDEEKLNKAKAEISKKLKKKKLSKEQFEEQLQEELSKIQSVTTRIEKLDWQEELALSNIDAMKEEIVNIVRKKRESGKDSFDLAPEKVGKLHDDRFYTACLLAYALQQERRKHLIQKRTTTNTQSLLDKLIIRPAKRNSNWV